jgi:hypothetical protein
VHEHRGHRLLRRETLIVGTLIMIVLLIIWERAVAA